jgi:hypothetical protein
MKNKENNVSETKPEKKRVAATMEGAQPRPNTSAAQTALHIGCVSILNDWRLAYVPKRA